MTTTLSPTVAAYIECALWSSNADHLDPEGTGCAGALEDHYGIEDFDADTLAAIAAEVDAFTAEHADDIEAADLDASQVGHDLWLTRNRHGAGFWDRDYVPGPRRDALMRLSDAAKACGESYIYAGDDGRLYTS